jgi:hypothetical protein
MYLHQRAIEFFFFFSFFFFFFVLFGGTEEPFEETRAISSS